MFGLLKDATIDEVRGYIDQLVAWDLLRQTDDQFPVLKLTAQGVALMKDPGAHPGLTLARQRKPEKGKRAEARRRRGRRRGTASIASCSTSLRALRLSIARDRGVPPYVVFHDTTLRELARRQAGDAGRAAAHLRHRRAQGRGSRRGRSWTRFARTRVICLSAIGCPRAWMPTAISTNLPRRWRPGAPCRRRSSLRSWLEIMADRNASDLLLVAGEPPALAHRRPRACAPTRAVLDGDDVLQTGAAASCAPHAQRAFRERGIADAALKVPGLGRFRVNLHRERGRPAATVRRLPTKVPSLASLNLPPAWRCCRGSPRGLVIVGGATGSGKTTTLAAIVDEINRRDEKHIITIEDPLEYEHTNQKSVIQHMEIGHRRAGLSDSAPVRAAAGARRASSSAKCAIRKRCRSRWRPARPGIWC